ncbi:aspartate/glutamate racemase family protein [Zwartia vadi]|uniref:aspartate/glutamate racemase family protein n=1 Tax=Zwartia vadi TaxID=3058168 RepID=UPI0025B32D0E|nr:aspartate/glutamate racemase family protein [Zwartia vadi]MDN3987982.1 aspartate/glutamate racemase family protein [Zwartia vadi]
MTTTRKIWLQSSSSDNDAAIWSVYQQAARRHARKVLSPQFDFEFHGVSRTYPAVDYSDSSFHLATREVVRNAILAEQNDYAGFVNVSTNETGHREIRELTDFPAVFITEAAVHLAAQIGGTFAFLTHNSGSRLRMEAFTRQYGLGEQLVEGASMNLTYHDFAAMYANPAPALESFKTEARKAIARGARVLIPAGGPLNMFFIENGFREVDGVPLLDILGLALKDVEAQIGLRDAGMLVRGPMVFSKDWKQKLRELFLVSPP